MGERSYFCIRGYMKSGTNWVCRILNLHPDVHSWGEFHWQRYFQAYAENSRNFQNLAKLEQEDAVIRRGIEKMVRESMDELAPVHAKFVGDRTPHTLHPVVLRNAPHISVIRDCRDVIVSKMFHYFNCPEVTRYFQRNASREKLRQGFAKDPWLFQKHPELLLTDERFVRQSARLWRRYLVMDRHTMQCHAGLPVMLVKYEEMHQDLAERALELVSFIGADPEKMPPIPKHLFPGHRQEQPNRFNRKGVVGDWKNYVNSEVARWIHEEAGDELLRQGYIDSVDWVTSTQSSETETTQGKAA